MLGKRNLVTDENENAKKPNCITKHDLELLYLELRVYHLKAIKQGDVNAMFK